MVVAERGLRFVVLFVRIGPGFLVKFDIVGCITEQAPEIWRLLFRQLLAYNFLCVMLPAEPDEIQNNRLKIVGLFQIKTRILHIKLNKKQRYQWLDASAEYINLA